MIATEHPFSQRGCICWWSLQGRELQVSPPGCTCSPAHTAYGIWGHQLVRGRAGCCPMAWAALSRAGLGAGPLPCLCFKMQLLNFQKTQRLSPGYVDAFTSPPTSHPVHSQQLYSSRIVPPSAIYGVVEKALSSQGARQGLTPPRRPAPLCGFVMPSPV